MRHISLLLAVAAVVAAAHPATAQTRNPIFTADKEACFGRAYDRAHLASHPQQKVTSLHIMRSLSERPEAENWTPDQRGDAIKKFQEDGMTDVWAFVTFRDRKGSFYNSLTCGRDDKGTITCAIDCDGGSFRLRRDGASSVQLNNEGFVLIGGCGEEVESSKEVYFKPGQDDKVFHLDSMPMAACRAAEGKAVPIRLGKPLRERFKENEAFCFGSDYDATHLSSHPQQKIASLRVGRLDPAKEKAEDPTPKFWWYNVELDVKLTLKGGANGKPAHYACTPDNASWECLRQTGGEGHSACNDRKVSLVRGEGDAITLINRSSGLPIDNECETASDQGQYPENPPTKSDDRTFRLTRMPVEMCR